jgi:hypothetical protein
MTVEGSTTLNKTRTREEKIKNKVIRFIIIYISLIERRVLFWSPLINFANGLFSPSHAVIIVIC